ncbi:rod shape-determining protein MreC [Leuconostocaceae bacterium ESL0958]|nr:rod shape-determining protein MreC [Leuconostocaceae bacterium ESL0958]
MKKWFSSRTLVTLMVSFLVIVGLIAGSNWYAQRRSQPPFFQRVFNDINATISKAIAWPTNAVGSRANSFANLLSTFEENKKLKAKIDNYAQTKVRLQKMTEENQSLKKQLGLKHTLTDYDTVSAVTISRAPTAWDSQLIINKGSNAGLKKGMPVLGDQGIVGRIAEVNTVNSKVSLISDNSEDANRFAITVKGDQGDVNGVISGYNTDQKVLEMGQVTNPQNIKEGDTVVTSGLGGIIPAGLYVGKVANISTDNYGLSKKVYIRPSSDLNALNNLLVAKTQMEQ